MRKNVFGILNPTSTMHVQRASAGGKGTPPPLPPPHTILSSLRCWKRSVTFPLKMGRNVFSRPQGPSQPSQHGPSKRTTGPHTSLTVHC
eukprot:3690201-Pyramimonas_sp.AAC.2